MVCMSMGLGTGGRTASFLGTAGNYAVFGLFTSPANGTFLNFSNVTVNGDVAEGPSGTGHVFAPSLVNGNYFYDTTATAPTLDAPGVVTGSVTQTSLTQANNDALAAYNTALGFAPTQTFGTISTATTINGNGGLNVIDINGNINLSDSNNLSLNGGPSDFFILNVTGGVTLDGSAQITGTGGVTASSLLINVIGTGNSLTSHVGNVINGTLLAPYRSLTFHSANGAILAGGEEIKLMSDATVNFTPLGPVPPISDASTIVLACFGALQLLAVRRKVFR